MHFLTQESDSFDRKHMSRQETDRRLGRSRIQPKKRKKKGDLGSESKNNTFFFSLTLYLYLSLPLFLLPPPLLDRIYPPLYSALPPQHHYYSCCSTSNTVATRTSYTLSLPIQLAAVDQLTTFVSSIVSTISTS